MTDISAGGLGVIAQLNVPAGMPCSIRFAIGNGPGQAAFSLDTQVAYSVLSGSSGFRIGLQFLRSAQGEVQRLSRLVGA